MARKNPLRAEMEAIRTEVVSLNITITTLTYQRDELGRTTKALIRARSILLERLKVLNGSGSKTKS